MPRIAFSLVSKEGSAPDRTLLFLHGLLGRGGNLRTIARHVVQRHPRWAVALCDVRMHGQSQGFAAPHTIAAAARDLLELDERLAAPVGGVLGHSLGGKIALAYFRLRADSLDHVIDVDASPSAQRMSGAGTDRVATLDALELLESLPSRLASRAELVERAIAAGFERSFGEWLAMNLAPIAGPKGGGFEMGIELPALRALLEDYLRVDQWDLLEAPPGRARIDVVVGERGGVFTGPDRERLARAVAAHPKRLFSHPLPTGHWVHVEDPDGLVNVVVEALGSDQAVQ